MRVPEDYEINQPPKPNEPDAAGAPTTNPPNQGDHVFGSIVSALETALKKIFEGGQLWETRFMSFNQPAYQAWQGMKALDLGHHAAGPAVTRPVAEVDRHAHVFGGYAALFQYEVLRLRKEGMVFRGSTSWAHRVVGAYRALQSNLVDRTALCRYINVKNLADDGTHTTISIATTRQLIEGIHNDRAVRIREVCEQYAALRRSLEQMLIALVNGHAGCWDNQADKWILFK